jgi:hypothetical protein
VFLIADHVGGHRWAFAVCEGPDAPLDSGEFTANRCWLPLRLLPRTWRRRWCRDRHEPTDRDVHAVLLPHGWWVPIVSDGLIWPHEPTGRLLFGVEALYRCPVCANCARIDADRGDPTPFPDRPAACAGHGSCGWTGPARELVPAINNDQD